MANVKDSRRSLQLKVKLEIYITWIKGFVVVGVSILPGFFHGNIIPVSSIINPCN
jgi:hypothetical protein